MEIQAKKVHSGKDVKEKILGTVKEIGDVVGSTMGAKGRNVVLEQDNGAPMIVNDGVTICRYLNFSDPIKNMVANLVKTAALRTNELAGDGTTTTTVLTQAIIEEGTKEIEESGINPILLRKSLDASLVQILSLLQVHSKGIKDEEDVIRIAKISCQDEHLGELIGKLMFKIKEVGAVTFKPSLQSGVFIENSAGMQISGSIAGGVLDNQNRWATKMNKAKVLILQDSPEDRELQTKWVPFLKQLSDGHMEGDKLVVDQVHVPYLVIVAEKLSRRFLLSMNNNSHTIKWVWFRPNTAGLNMKEIYKDLAALLGTKPIHEESGVYLSKFNISELGNCEGVDMDRFRCVFSTSEEQSKSNVYLDRVNVVKEQLEQVDSEEERQHVFNRYASLVGGVAEIKIQAGSESETEELKFRIEDAVNACRSAMEEGVISGGGVALLDISDALNEETAGMRVLKKALKRPAEKITENAGIEKPYEAARRQLGFGYNVLSGEVVDMMNQGIIDPHKVARIALMSAVSVGGLLLTSDYVVTRAKKEGLGKLKEIINGQG